MSIEGSSGFPPFGSKTIVFIDADNVERGFEQSLNRRKISSDLAEAFSLQQLIRLVHGRRKYLFSATPDGGEPKSWLKALRAEQDHIYRSGKLKLHGRRSKQEGVDVMIAVEAIRLAHNKVMDECILFSGDGDLVPLVRYLVELGVRTIVCGFDDPDFGSDNVATRLRDEADHYIHIGNSILKNCLKSEHRFFGTSYYSRAELLNIGNQEDSDIDPEAKQSIKMPDGTIYLIWDGNTENHSYMAKFGSELGARAFHRLHGPIRWR